MTDYMRAQMKYLTFFLLGSTWQGRKSLNSPPPIDLTNLQLHIGSYPLKGTWKLGNQGHHTKNKRIAWRLKGEAEILSCGGSGGRELHPSSHNPQRGGISETQRLFPRREGLSSTLGTPSVQHRTHKPCPHRQTPGFLYLNILSLNFFFFYC